MKREHIAIPARGHIPRLRALIGGLMLAAGAFCAVAAVLELGAYRLFAEGGRFHYEGYGPGSVMFALISLSLLAYAGLAAILLPLGYGHVRRLAWSVVIAESLTWVWFIVGLPLLAGTALLTLMFKPTFSLGALVLLAVASLLAYPVGPLLLLWLYRRARAAGGLRGDVSAAPPLPVRGAAALLAFLAAASLLPILLGAPFPWFGQIVSGAAGVVVLVATSGGLGLAAWGVLRGRAWGWAAVAAILLLLAATATVTAARLTVGQMIDALVLAPTEAGWFAGLPFREAHPVVAGLVPPGLVAIVLLAARRAAGPSDR